jgi:hypothetical protein
VALSYNLAVTLFGGLAPLTVATLTEVTGSQYVPAFYVVFAALVSLALVPAFYVVFAALVSLALVAFTRTGQTALASDRADKKHFFSVRRVPPTA